MPGDSLGHPHCEHAFDGEARALGNLTGNCVATVVIAAWEGDIDRERAHAVLNGTYNEETADILSEPEPA